MNKKAYSLLELMLVVVLIGMFITAFSHYIQSDNKNFLKAQTCMNYTIGEIKNYFTYAVSGKGLYSGASSAVLYPDIYTIEFDQINHNIQFAYSGEDSGTGVYERMFLQKDGTTDKKYFCYSNNYFINMTGTFGIISLNTLGHATLSAPGGVLIDNNRFEFTGYIQFDMCHGDTSDCRILGQFEIDRRVNNIFYKRCLIRENSLKDCKRYSE